jgi:hypothetical protein
VTCSRIAHGPSKSAAAERRRLGRYAADYLREHIRLPVGHYLANVAAFASYVGSQSQT